MESGDFLASCTCIYSTSRERKRLFGCYFTPWPGFRVGKISQCASAWLDESRAWVLRKSLFYECTTSACNSPLLKPLYGGLQGRFPCFAPMRLPFTSTIVAHSRYLPGFQLESLTDSTWTELALLNHRMSNVLLNHIASLEDKYLGKAHIRLVDSTSQGNL